LKTGSLGKRSHTPQLAAGSLITIERLFGWKDKFRRLLLRFDRLSQLHYAFKTLTYTIINLRHFCRS
jgi:hypothetical protein